MSSGGGAGPLVPTFHGFVHNSMDGLVLFEACLSGKLHHVPRRPHDRERASLIKSGSIFIYEENASGIKRWTDGVAWSPSRILGNFLIYRELEKPFPPGEKKRAMKRKRTSLPGEPYPRRDSDDNEPPEMVESSPQPQQQQQQQQQQQPQGGEVKPEIPGADQDKELERSLIGSLVDSYGFRPDGLVKKTMSISVNGISHHMVSYYKVDDVKNNLLPRPLSDPRLQNISVRPELYLKQNFRAPVEETEHYAIDGHMHAHPQMMYSSMAGGYGIRPGQYFGGQQQYPMYSMNTTTGANMYGGMTAPAWPNQQASAGAMQYGHQGYGSQAYHSPYYKGGNSGESPAQPIKAEAAPPGGSSYNSQYGYSNMPRDGSQGTPNVAQSNYHTPVPPGSSTFSGRPSYGGPTSPTTNGQSQHMYSSAPSQAYAVRSPPQAHNYSVSSGPSSAVIPSPHNGVRSPVSGGPGGAPNSGPDPYRTGSYGGAPGGHASSDVNGLGISNNANYAQPPQTGGNYAYPGAQQPYRSEVAIGQNTSYAS